MRSFFLEKEFCGLARGKKSHVQHFNLTLAGGKLSFLENPTYHREIWASNGILCFRVLSPNPLHLWNCCIGKENVICHVLVGLDGLCIKCSRKKSLLCILHVCSIFGDMCTYAYTCYIHYIYFYIDLSICKQ